MSSRRGALGGPPPPRSPLAVRCVAFWRKQDQFTSCLRSFCCITTSVSCLQVVPVLRSCCLRCVAELPPPTDGAYLIDDEGQRVLWIAGLIVMDRPKPPATDATGRSHRFESRTVLPTQTAICISGVTHRPSGNNAPLPFCTGWVLNSPRSSGLIRGGSVYFMGGRSATHPLGIILYPEGVEERYPPGSRRSAKGKEKEPNAQGIRGTGIPSGRGPVFPGCHSGGTEWFWLIGHLHHTTEGI